MRIVPVVVAVALVAGACSGAAAPASTTTTVAGSTTTTSEADVPECLSGDLPFVDDGVVAVLDSDGSDARAIGEIRRISAPSCERIEVSFLSDVGAPASGSGPIDVSVLPDAGIVRVSLSGDITDATVADTTLNGSIIDHWYVVGGISDGLVIDLHLNVRASVRAFATESPAMLVVDLATVGDDRPITPASVADGFVLLGPRPGVALYPLSVVGYAAPDVDAVRLRLTDPAGVAVDRSLPTLAPSYVWHAFEATLDDGPSGAVELFVGTVDTGGEPGAGILVPLDLP